MPDLPQNAYLALPPTGKGPGLLVLHAWWGLNDFVKDFCRRLAEEGYVAIAPDLFDGKIATTPAEAEKLSSGADMEKIADGLVAAADQMGSLPEVSGKALGVIGFSFGAFWALWLSARQSSPIHAVTVFYGTGPDNFSQSQAAYLGHYAESDPYEPPVGVKELEKYLRSAGRPAALYTYPGTGHWFFESDRSDAFNPTAAKLAWERTLEFLKEQLPI
jgi:carboxymethylenebutenolidase